MIITEHNWKEDNEVILTAELHAETLPDGETKSLLVELAQRLAHACEAVVSAEDEHTQLSL